MHAQAAELGEPRSAGSRHSHQHDAHARALVDDYDPVAVTELQHLLCVGVMAGAEGVGAQPAKQVEVLHQCMHAYSATSVVSDSL